MLTTDNIYDTKTVSTTAILEATISNIELVPGTQNTCILQLTLDHRS
jgi:hypothetical protein